MPTDSQGGNQDQPQNQGTQPANQPQSTDMPSLEMHSEQDLTPTTPPLEPPPAPATQNSNVETATSSVPMPVPPQQQPTPQQQVQQNTGGTGGKGGGFKKVFW